MKIGYVSILGISESERERRKQSNILTTKINFLAWLIEVIQTFWIQNWGASNVLYTEIFDWGPSNFLNPDTFCSPACGADNSNYFCSQPCVASPVENDHSPSSHQHCRASLLHRCCRKGEVEESEVTLFSAEQCPPDECTPDVPRDGIKIGISDGYSTLFGQDGMGFGRNIGC